VYLACIGSRTRLKPSQRQTSVEQRQGASRRTTKPSLLHVYNVLPDQEAFRPQDLRLDLSNRVTLSRKGLGYMELLSGEFNSTCGRMPTQQSSKDRIFRQIMIPLSLSLSEPPRRLTQEAASTARAQRDRHTSRTIMFHLIDPQLFGSQFP